jgi:hypothetical protein
VQRRVGTHLGYSAAPLTFTTATYLLTLPTYLPIQSTGVLYYRYLPARVLPTAAVAERQRTAGRKGSVCRILFCMVISTRKRLYSHHCIVRIDA